MLYCLYLKKSMISQAPLKQKNENLHQTFRAFFMVKNIDLNHFDNILEFHSFIFPILNKNSKMDFLKLWMTWGMFSTWFVISWEKQCLRKLGDFKMPIRLCGKFDFWKKKNAGLAMVKNPVIPIVFCFFQDCFFFHRHHQAKEICWPSFLNQI